MTKEKLNHLFEESYDTLQRLGIPIADRKRVSVAIDRALRYNQAFCCYFSDGTFRVDLPKECLKEPKPYRETQKRILHELLHTCPGGMEHNDLYKAHRQQIKEEAGIDVFGGINDPASAALPSIMTYTCPACDITYDHRRPGPHIEKKMKQWKENYQSGIFIPCPVCKRPIQKDCITW